MTEYRTNPSGFWSVAAALSTTIVFPSECVNFTRSPATIVAVDAGSIWADRVLALVIADNPALTGVSCNWFSFIMISLCG